MTLRLFVLAILSGSVALGPAIYALFEYVQWLKCNVPNDYKRVTVAVVSGLLGIGAWALALWLGWVEQPAIYSPEFVLNGIWSYGVMAGLSAFTSSQILHGQLSKGYDETSTTQTAMPMAFADLHLASMGDPQYVLDMARVANASPLDSVMPTPVEDQDGNIYVAAYVAGLQRVWRYNNRGKFPDRPIVEDIPLAKYTSARGQLWYSAFQHKLYLWGFQKEADGRNHIWVQNIRQFDQTPTLAAASEVVSA